jgi:hypothetical protein
MRTSQIVVAGLLLLGACGSDGDDSASDAGDQAAEADLSDVVVERVGDYTHPLGDLDYDVPAPSGGDHPPAPYWLTCGVYEGQVPDELAVHSLEHGAVWIALGPGSTADDRAAAEALAEGSKVFVSDVPELPNPVELVAWGARLPLDSVADERAEAFVEEFVDGSGAPEAGASCDSLGDPPTPPDLPTE